MESFINTPTPQTTAALHAFELMLDDDPLRQRVTAELRERRFPLPAWVTHLAQAK